MMPVPPGRAFSRCLPSRMSPYPGMLCVCQGISTAHVPGLCCHLVLTPTLYPGDKCGCSGWFALLVQREPDPEQPQESVGAQRAECSAPEEEYQWIPGDGRAAGGSVPAIPQHQFPVPLPSQSARLDCIPSLSSGCLCRMYEPSQRSMGERGRCLFRPQLLSNTCAPP